MSFSSLSDITRYSDSYSVIRCTVVFSPHSSSQRKRDAVCIKPADSYVSTACMFTKPLYSRTEAREITLIQIDVECHASLTVCGLRQSS